MTVEKKILDNKTILVTTVEEQPRYTGYAFYDTLQCEAVRDDFVEQNKIWTVKRNREGFECLDTGESWEPEGKSVEDDIESFQKYLDEEYGKDKYVVYALGAYIHGGVSFAFNTGEDRRCHWDSGTIGFIGINKEMYDYWVKNDISINHYASMLTDAWNGNIITYQVIDNYTGDEIDMTDDLDYQMCQKWQTETQEKYGIDWSEVNVKY